MTDSTYHDTNYIPRFYIEKRCHRVLCSVFKISTMWSLKKTLCSKVLTSFAVTITVSSLPDELLMNKRDSDSFFQHK